ncbi:mitochondrial carnitine/acylcarnitine carrier protein-like isoform X1 [Oscarella lobularis]|uniref:mitochondrial carnitine/acylcarnitine carrier protein-like isoform X1 n=1 Tax=Oscarella lobularis TaxID=121494 RepID=UPI0033142F77
MAERQSPVKSFFAGSCGGMCLVIVGHPFDTIKVRMQTMPVPLLGELPVYKNAFDCFRKTLSNESWMGLYKGMTAPLLYVIPLASISFGAYAGGCELIAQNNPTKELNSVHHFLAGCLAGFCSGVLVVPTDRIKCLLQIQTESGVKRQYTGPFDVVRTIVKQSGIRGLFQGTCITLIRDIPANGLFYAAYDWCKKSMTPKKSLVTYTCLIKLYMYLRLLREHQVNLLQTILAGGIAGVVNWSYAILPDAIKSRLQTAPYGRYPRGARDVIRHVVKVEGIGALYRGFGPVILRAFPANAGCFLGYEAALNFLNKAFPSNAAVL